MCVAPLVRAHLEVFALKVVDLALCALELVLERGLLLLQLGDVHRNAKGARKPDGAARAHGAALWPGSALEGFVQWGVAHTFLAAI